MRISDLSSDVCSSPLLASFLGEPLDAVELDLLAIVGADPTREAPEDLVGLGALVAPRQLSVLVVGGVEHDIELPAGVDDVPGLPRRVRSEEHTSELQSIMRISYAVFCFKK